MKYLIPLLFLMSCNQPEDLVFEQVNPNLKEPVYKDVTIYARDGKKAAQLNNNTLVFEPDYSCIDVLNTAVDSLTQMQKISQDAVTNLTTRILELEDQCQ